MEKVVVTLALAINFTAGPSCAFDYGDCGWTQGTLDNAQWQKLSRQTATANTGPNSDHTLATGYGM